MSAKYRVWNVYGYVAGNVAVVGVYHFKERTLADQHATRVNGYVLPANLAHEPDRNPTAVKGK